MLEKYRLIVALGSIIATIIGIEIMITNDKNKYYQQVPLTIDIILGTTTILIGKNENSARIIQFNPVGEFYIRSNFV